MINGLGVFGWGVGGIEAEAAMLASRSRAIRKSWLQAPRAAAEGATATTWC